MHTHRGRKQLRMMSSTMYVISAQHTSFDWNSFVTAKNVSVASVEFRGVPYRRKKYEAIHIHHTNDVSWITPLNYTIYGTVSRYVVCSSCFCHHIWKVLMVMYMGALYGQVLLWLTLHYNQVQLTSSLVCISHCSHASLASSHSCTIPV